MTVSKTVLFRPLRVPLPFRVFALASIGAIALSGCADTPLGNALENALAAETHVDSAPVNTPPPAPLPEVETPTLPDDFPDAIPLYPGAILEATGDRFGRWTSLDSSDAIALFYRSQLRENNWQVTTENGSAIEARRNGLKIDVTVATSLADLATITIDYELLSGEKTQTKTTPNPTETAPETVEETATQFSDLDETPTPLQPYVEDVAKLDILTAKEGDQFAPNQPITRREFARWLFAANNTIYANRAGYQVRPGSNLNPAFQDVPSSDRDFAAIQGLAEAGIIPSPLSGETTAVQFNPDTPLNREDFLLWKVPVDWRRSLPTATIESVQQTWGFQDAPRIDPKALRAVLADFQNGELSNIRRSFGYTTLLQPKKAVTRAEAGAALWYFGNGGEGRSAREVLE